MRAAGIPGTALRAEVAGLERRSGYLMVLLDVTNPTGQAIGLGPGSGLTPLQGDPLGLTIADRTDQLRRQPCRMSVGRAVEFAYLADPSTEYALDGANSVPGRCDGHLPCVLRAPDCRCLECRHGGRRYRGDGPDRRAELKTDR